MRLWLVGRLTAQEVRHGGGGEGEGGEDPIQDTCDFFVFKPART